MGWAPEEGGLNRYLRGLLSSIRQVGDEVGRGWQAEAVVTGSPPDPGPGVFMAATGREPILLRVGRCWVAANRAASRTSVVDAHFALYCVLPVTTSALRRHPLVVHFQGPWAAESAVDGASRAAVAAKRLLERTLYRRADAVITLSSAFRRLAVESYGVSPWKVSVIPPGVDLQAFAPGDRLQARARLGVPGDARAALVVRRLVNRVGIDVLLRAWADLAIPAEAGVLLVVGTGPERARLESLASQLGLDEAVRFLGAVSDDTLVHCYRAADVCVVPSVALEGFGLVVLESLATGTPVITTDAGGLAEAIGGLDPGLVVPAGDSGSLAARLRTAFDHSAPLPDSTACRSYARGFAWPEVARRNLAVYEQVLRPRPSRKLRVVYLDHCARLSGGELALLRLIPAMEEVEAHVILAEEGPLVDRLAQAGISTEVLPMAEVARGLSRGQARPESLGVRAGGAAALYTAALRSRLVRLGPDLVHTNSLKSALYGGVAARMAAIPVIWHVRDRIADDYLPRAAVSVIRLLARRLPRLVVANSQATLDTLEMPRGLGTVVPSPIDPSATPRLPRATDGALRVGMVGRISPWKGQHVFLDAFHQAFPGGIEEAVIVGAPLFGPGEESYDYDLRRQVGALGLQGRVELTGFRSDIAAELAQLDILVHASLVPEPFGQVVVEGMSAGLAVVAADAGGPAELVTDGVDGLLFPPGDAPALAAALRRLGADGALRRALGARARQRAAAFTPLRVAEQMTRAYHQALHQP